MGSKPEDAGLPVTDGLLGWWKFNEGTGNTIIDYSGNGNHGAILGTGASWTQKGLKTTLTSSIDTTNLLDFYTEKKFTWILAYKYGAPTNSFPTLMGASPQGMIYAVNLPTWHHETYWFFARDSNGNVYTDEYISPDYSIKIDEDIILAVTYDDPNFVTYLDNEIVFSENLPGILYPESSIFHFSDTDSDYSNDYDFYYALIYNRTLTAQEVADVYAFIQVELENEEG